MTELNLHFWIGFALGILTTLAILELSLYLANRKVKRLNAIKNGKQDADYICNVREGH